MKIIIIGDGKIGSVLAERLSLEKHDVTIIDRSADALERSNKDLDVMVIQGDGASAETQMEAGVEDADMVIASTGADELNILCCLIARKLGAKHTIARVRNPGYAQEIRLIKDELGLSMSINPERETAREMARVLRLPSAIKIDTFAKGQVEILKLNIPSGSPLCGLTLIEMAKTGPKVLVCAVERGEDGIYIPSGDFRLQEGDRISVVASPANAGRFIRWIGVGHARVKNVMLIGGGRITYYLARHLINAGMKVKIIEMNRERCESLSQEFPEATVICGDGTDHRLLLEEGLENMDAVASLTGIDEENILISLYCRSAADAKRITKISRDSYSKIVDDLDIGSIFYPRSICADNVARYVRAMEASNKFDSIESLIKIADGKAEALEFHVSADSGICGIPLMKLKLKKNLLIGCINRYGRNIIPRGSDTIAVGDNVIVVTTHSGLHRLEEILE